MEAERAYDILVIEDNTADALILQEALKECDGPAGTYRVRIITDSRETIPYLRSPERSFYSPDLFILDYRMPIDGGLALIALKGDPAFLHIPVVVVTGSRSPEDICDIYRRGANCCFYKPDTLDEYQKLAMLITEHWLGRITLPRCRRTDV